MMQHRRHDADRGVNYVLSRMSINDSRWLQFVQAREAAWPFHHPAWASLLAECYGLRVCAATMKDADGAIVAGLPIIETRGLMGGRRWVSLPFTDFCPPLATSAETA